MNILDEIVSVKKTKLPIDLTVKQREDPIPFLQKDAFQIIAEVKKGSPSLGLLKPDLDVCETAIFYEHNGASAVSVLTEEDHFYGSVDDLKKVKQHISIPVIRKDFIFTKEQIIESYNLGADAILLIVSVLKTIDKVKELIDFAENLKLSILLETHNADEINIAIAAGAKIIGINNRNLKTFKTDIQTSIDLKSHIPPHIISVSESGIHTLEDLNTLKTAGFDAVLIGEAFIRNKDFLKEI